MQTYLPTRWVLQLKSNYVECRKVHFMLFFSACKAFFCFWYEEVHGETQFRNKLYSHSPNNFLINQHVQVGAKSQKRNAILARKLFQ